MTPPPSDGAAFGPSAFAAALRTSLETDVLAFQPDPLNADHLERLARWGRPWGVVEALAETPEHQALSASDLISLHPHRFDEVAAACKAVQERFLRAQVARLEACGSAWSQGHVLRIFWRDGRGRERLRKQIGIHRCKQAWCPDCGKSRQARLTGEVERLLLLARDFGLGEGHARLVTLTVPNGDDVEVLRELGHDAFARLQRTRWWNRFAFGWVRGTEVVTGQDGAWNLHLHLLVLFWSPKVSYRQLGEAWTRALGGPRANGRNYVVDVETLEAHRGKAGGLLRAARYITKYLAKPEELRNLAGGPGGLAHLVGATRGLRRFAVGGGMAVLRRAAGILLPGRALEAEQALAGTWLCEGRPPWRAELLDPRTGEVVDAAPTRLRERREQALEAWGGVLAGGRGPGGRRGLPGRVVGLGCGRRAGLRRLGPLPLAGPAPTVKAFERQGAAVVTGLRSLLGEWKVFRWAEGELRFAAVLPAARYSWKPAAAALRRALAYGTDAWSLRRRQANREGSVFLAEGRPPLGGATGGHPTH